VNQTVATKTLEKMGHSVVVANNGSEALSMLAMQPFDLVFMDVQMPEMDGLAATKRIREHEKQTRFHVPIIAMTAHAMTGDRERCLNAGMDGYVSKPINGKKLEQAIASVVTQGIRWCGRLYEASARGRLSRKRYCLGCSGHPQEIRWR
jgi:two-component system sensor histidine kinase/response regulator